MSNIVILVPKERILEKVQHVITADGISVRQLKAIETSNAVNEARYAIQEGTDVIIARGIQAQLIKDNTKIPVVEIRLTGQELGLLVTQAKRMTKNDCPIVAIIGFRNQFSNTDHFDELFGIHLHIYYIKKVEDIPQMVELAANEHADVIIGGDMVNQLSGNMGISSIFLDSGEESIREAIDIARRIEYASDLEKRDKAQLQTILETSFCGITRIDSAHRITDVNYLMERILNKAKDSLLGEPIESVIADIDAALIENLLNGSHEWATSAITVNDKPLMVMASPVEYDSQCSGAVLSFMKVGSFNKLPSDDSREMYLNGFFAHATFRDIVRFSPEMERCVELAKAYSLTNKPVLIYGETGTEKEIFAQAIHNNSSRKSQPFITVACIQNDPNLFEMLFGSVEPKTGQINKRGLLAKANYGTVYINNIENMCLACQYKLFTIIQQNFMGRIGTENSLFFSTRILVSATRDLIYMVRNGEFLEGLYYILNSFSFEIPPLRKSPNEIKGLAESYIKKYSEQYYKFIELSDNAWKKLCGFPWRGNLIQLEYFCERIVLTAVKRMLDEEYIEDLLAELYPVVRMNNGEEKITVFKYPQAAKIADLMDKYAGNKTMVAKELGVSSTTLWRYIKKYGIKIKYDF